MSLLLKFAGRFAIALTICVPSLQAHQALAETGGVYQIHRDGKVWKYTGTPCSETGCPGWALLTDTLNPYAAVATRGRLYIIRRNESLVRNEIWQYQGQGVPGWAMIDENPASFEIFAGGGKLYQRHSSGEIWEYIGPECGTGCPGWRQIDRGAYGLVAGGTVLYELSPDDARIYRLGPQGKQLIDNNPATNRLVGAGEFLYRLAGGALGAFTGQPCRQNGDCSQSWHDLGVYGDINIIRAGRRNDYHVVYIRDANQIKVDSAEYPFNGHTVDNDPQVRNFVAAGDALYKLMNNGDIFAYSDKRPDGCDSQEDCRNDWVRIDANGASDQIIADVE